MISIIIPVWLSWSSFEVSVGHTLSYVPSLLISLIWHILYFLPYSHPFLSLSFPSFPLLYLLIFPSPFPCFPSPHNPTLHHISTVAGPDINLLRDDSPQSQGSLCSIDLFFKEVGIDLLSTITYFLQKMVLFGETFLLSTIFLDRKYLWSPCGTCLPSNTLHLHDLFILNMDIHLFFCIIMFFNA